MFIAILTLIVYSFLFISIDVLVIKTYQVFLGYENSIYYIFLFVVFYYLIFSYLSDLKDKIIKTDFKFANYIILIFTIMLMANLFYKLELYCLGLLILQFFVLLKFYVIKLINNRKNYKNIY